MDASILRKEHSFPLKGGKLGWGCAPRVRTRGENPHLRPASCSRAIACDRRRCSRTTGISKKFPSPLWGGLGWGSRGVAILGTPMLTQIRLVVVEMRSASVAATNEDRAKPSDTTRPPPLPLPTRGRGISTYPRLVLPSAEIICDCPAPCRARKIALANQSHRNVLQQAVA
jgi:hypothetical protein